MSETSRLPQQSLHTVAVTAGRPAQQPDAPLNPPVTLASTYVAGGELEYGRYSNPTWQAFEDVLGRLEGGRALVYASGLAAVAACLELVPEGGVVAASRHAYLGSLGQLADSEQLGRLSVRLVDIDDTEAVRRACAGADLLWIESPTNPAMEVADLDAVCGAARDAGAISVCDNTFATPLLQRPLEHAADLVLHSATKYLAGHSDVLLGAVVCGRKDHYERLESRRRRVGAVPGPFETWLALRGLRTLPLRVERASDNAAELARRLHSHSAVERVRYPGLPDDPGHARANAQMARYGGVFSIEVAGGAEAAEEFTRRTSLWVRATSLGGVESTLERRRRWLGEVASIPDNLVRLSVGIEDLEDLWRDLGQALR